MAKPRGRKSARLRGQAPTPGDGPTEGEQQQQQQQQHEEDSSRLRGLEQDIAALKRRLEAAEQGQLHPALSYQDLERAAVASTYGVFQLSAQQPLISAQARPPAGPLAKFVFEQLIAALSKVPLFAGLMEPPKDETAKQAYYSFLTDLYALLPALQAADPAPNLAAAAAVGLKYTTLARDAATQRMAAVTSMLPGRQPDHQDFVMAIAKSAISNPEFQAAALKEAPAARPGPAPHQPLFGPQFAAASSILGPMQAFEPPPPNGPKGYSGKRPLNSSYGPYPAAHNPALRG